MSSMAVATISQYQPVAGRRDELVKVLGEAKSLAEQNGAQVRVRATVLG